MSFFFINEITASDAGPDIIRSHLLSNKTFQVFIFENIHINKSYIIKFLVNIWNHGKNLQDLSGKPLLKLWTAVIFGHLS